MALGKTTMRTNLNTWLLIFVFILTMASVTLADTTLYVDGDASPDGGGRGKEEK